MQADDNRGRLCIEDQDGAPVFLNDLAAELDVPDADAICGLLYIPLDRPEEPPVCPLEEDEDRTIQ